MNKSSSVQKSHVDHPYSEFLSSEQRRFYYLHKIDAHNSEIYLTTSIRISGLLDLNKLKKCLATVVQSNPIMKARFPLINEQPVIVIPEEFEPNISVIDLSLLGQSERTTKAEQMIIEEASAQISFQLETGPLFKIFCIQMSNSEYFLVFRVHHIILDAASSRLFLIELIEEYGGRQSKNSHHQFHEFIAWEKKRSESKATKNQMEYWREKLKLLSIIDLSLDNDRPNVHTHKAETVSLAFPKDLLDTLTDHVKKNGVTPYIYLLAVFNVLMNKLSKQTDLVIGTPISTRTEPEFQKMLGILVGWIVFRNNVNIDTSFDEFLSSVRADAFKSYENQNLSLERLFTLVDRLDRNPNRNPLFQVVFNFVQYPKLPKVNGLTMAATLLPPQKTHFDLSMLIQQDDEGLAFNMTYYADILHRETAKKVLDFYVELVRHFIVNGGEKLSVKALPEQLTRLNRHAETQLQKIVIASTFTSEPVESGLNFWLKKVKLPSKIEFAPLDQVFQELINPMSDMSINKLGVNIILLRFEDWKDPKKAVEELLPLLQRHSDTIGASMIVAVCPASEKFMKDNSSLQESLESFMTHELKDHAKIHLLTSLSLTSTYPVSDINDPESDAYGKIPYSPEFYLTMGTMLARKIHSFRRPAPKVIVLDCDNTLWKGIVGEDGIDGISVDKGRDYLQRFMLEQMRAGVLLCIASKNNENDVWEVFEKRQDMQIKREHIVAHRINWQPKSQNIASMAAELNLGIDSFMFIDDSPVECAEVKTNCPSILTLQVPGESAQIVSFLEHVWMLDNRKTTDTDKKRTEMYQQNAQREQLKKRTGSLEDFVDSLAVKIDFPALTEETIPRVSQMTQRTNQFNFTTIRRSEFEISALACDPNIGILIVDVSDRFGDYGIVGLVIYKTSDEKLTVDTFLLSCRALGRGVEQKIVAKLGEIAKSKNIENIEIPFHVTAKNKPARQFVDATFKSFMCEIESEKIYTYEVPVETAIEVANRVMTVKFEEEDKKAVKALPAPEVSSEQWAEIAFKLKDVNAIMTELRSTGEKGRSINFGRFLPPRNPLEEQICNIWKDVLGIERVGIQDNFFSLGGDSIRSLQITSQLKKIGMTLSPSQIYEYPTVEDLANLCVDGKFKETSTLRSGEGFLNSTGPYSLANNQIFLIKCYDQENRTAVHAPSGAYHFQYAIRFSDSKGDFSPLAIEQALTILFEAHPMLRTYAKRQGTSHLLCESESIELPLQSLNYASLDSSAQDDQLDRVMAEDRKNPFDPASALESKIRFKILLRTRSSFDFLISAHHGFCDGWGLQEFMNDLVDLYFAYKVGDTKMIATKRAELAGCAKTYREFVALEETVRHSQETTHFWEKFSEDIPNTKLRGGTRTLTTQDNEVKIEIDAAAVARVSDRARVMGVPLKTIFLSPVFDIATAISKSEHSVLAVVTNGRSHELTTPMKSFGLYWGFLPISVATNSDKTNQIMEIKKKLGQAENHSRFPLEAMLGGIDPNKVITGSFNFINFHNERWQTDAKILKVNEIKVFHRFHFPFNVDLRIFEGNKPAELSINWNWNWLNRSEANQLIHDYIEKLAIHLRG